MGGCLCLIGEPTQWGLAGVMLVIGSAVCRVLKTLLQASLMSGRQAIGSNALLYYAAPFNLCLYGLGSGALEGSGPWRDVTKAEFGGRGWVLLCLASAAAGIYNVVSFLLIKHLGALGSLVFGNLKTPSIVIVSYFIFGNVCSWLQVCGWFVVTAGLILYRTHGKEVDARGTEDENAEVHTADADDPSSAESPGYQTNHQFGGKNLSGIFSMHRLWWLLLLCSGATWAAVAFRKPTGGATR